MSHRSMKAYLRTPISIKIGREKNQKSLLTPFNFASLRLLKGIITFFLICVELGLHLFTLRLYAFYKGVIMSFLNTKGILIIAFSLRIIFNQSLCQRLVMFLKLVACLADIGPTLKFQKLKYCCCHNVDPTTIRTKGGF